MKSLALVLVLLAWFAAPARADVDSGVAAFKQGDYATALREFKPLAELGNARAQFNLGYMYDKGHGVPQDFQEAVRWYRLAAEQEYVRAQTHLGAMYERGAGVPQDYVLALMWLNLAAAQDQKDVVVIRDKLAKGMTPTQIAEAQKLARKWKPKKCFIMIPGC